PAPQPRERRGLSRGFRVQELHRTECSRRAGRRAAIYPGDRRTPEPHPGDGRPPELCPGDGRPPQPYAGHRYPPEPYAGDRYPPQPHPGYGHPPEPYLAELAAADWSCAVGKEHRMTTPAPHTGPQLTAPAVPQLRAGIVAARW